MTHPQSDRPASAEAGVPAHHEPRTLQVVLAAAAGNVVEFYDNVTFGLLAASIGAAFFPSTDPTTSLLAAFSAFAITFVARPFGGMLFGSLGDRIGRQRTLVMVITLMTAATFAIGVLPTYRTIGVFAPILLVLCRILQGLSFGGELGGVLAFVVEYANPRKRGGLVGWVMTAAFVGSLLGTAIVTLIAVFIAPDALRTWGWRIPFLVAGPIGFIGLYIRRRLEETPSFRRILEAGKAEQAPLRTVMRTQIRALLVCAGLAMSTLLPVYLMEAYNTNYLLVSVHVSESEALTATLVATLVAMAMTFVSARLSDRFGRKPVLLASLILGAILAIPAYLLITAGAGEYAIAGQSVMGVIRGAATGIGAIVMIELFPTALRYSGFALAYGVTAAVFGGTAPLVATALVSLTGSPLTPAFFLIATLIVSLVATAFVRDGRRAAPHPHEAGHRA